MRLLLECVFRLFQRVHHLGEDIGRIPVSPARPRDIDGIARLVHLERNPLQVDGQGQRIAEPLVLRPGHELVFVHQDHIALGVIADFILQYHDFARLVNREVRLSGHKQREDLQLGAGFQLPSGEERSRVRAIQYPAVGVGPDFTQVVGTAFRGYRPQYIG